MAHFGPRAIAATARVVAPFVEATGAPNEAVDVGAGSGAAALVLQLLGVKTVHLVDQSARALDMAERLLTSANVKGSTFKKVVVDARGRARPFNHADWLLSSFAFGELSRSRTEGDDPRATFAQLEAWAPNARRVFIIDAGDRVRARAIQTARDALVAEGRGILAPCPHADPCPALVRERDWCHTRAPKNLPPAFAELERRIGRDEASMSLAYLVVGRGGEGPKAAGVRVIGDPHVEKGRSRLPVCGPGGLRFVQATRKHRAAHDALGLVERGAVLDPCCAIDVRGNTAHVDAPDQLVARPPSSDDAP